MANWGLSVRVKALYSETEAKKKKNNSRRITQTKPQAIRCGYKKRKKKLQVVNKNEI